jgi:hypothetical protein
MKHGLGSGLALVVAATTFGIAAAAEPPAHAPNTPTPAATRPAAATTPAAAPATAAAAKRLDLRIGDVRKYMMPRDFQTTLRAPDADANTVVVEGQREVVPMRMVEDVPGGLAGLWYAVKDPKNSWRLFAPVVHFEDGPTVDKVPPPIFRWGP